MIGKKFFLNVRSGFFSEKPDTGQAVNAFSQIEGHLLNISYKATSNGDILRLHIVDENNFYLLSMFANSRAAHAFYMIIKNIDPHTAMAFKIKQIEGKDAFYVKQYGETVKWYYGKHNVSDKVPVEMENRLPFLRNMVESEILPVLQKRVNPFPYHPVYKPSKGIQCGYFDAYKSNGRIPGPISSQEKKEYKS